MSTIIVDENIGVKQVKVFYETLKEESEKEDDIILDFSSVRRVDLSIIQLLISFQGHIKEKKKIMKIKNISDDLMDQLKITGLAR